MFDYAGYARALREELHRIPEIGFDLPKTLAVVHRELEAMGLAHTDKYGPSSVVAYINPGMPFTIGLRGDMDALPASAEKLGVRSLPTLVVFRDGGAVRRSVGVQSAAGILEQLR
jgi:metal-dependent amidase/aminoacylase/carboxypeptidase family protein